jgi:hypothetical protein
VAYTKWSRHQWQWMGNNRREHMTTRHRPGAFWEEAINAVISHNNERHEQHTTRVRW